jgi:hypothetical protein
VSVFLDTSVLLAGLIDLGPQSAPAQSIFHAIVETRVTDPATAWHCCLEFFSIATRMPAEYRVSPADAVTLLQDEVFGRMAVYDLPAADRLPMLRAATRAHRRDRARCRRLGRRDRQPPPLSHRAPIRHPRRNAGGVSRPLEGQKVDLGSDAVKTAQFLNSV